MQGFDAIILFSGRNDVVQSRSRPEIRTDDQCLRCSVLRVRLPFRSFGKLYVNVNRYFQFRGSRFILHIQCNVALALHVQKSAWMISSTRQFRELSLLRFMQVIIKITKNFVSHKKWHFHENL